ncbi:type II toxin-antitoxin system PemK/MazF family toxin [Pleurocapsa sp. CCALA 161]|jgi:mRNA interferase MazF|uniref:type II toxin-antitoxin system PemK/MazF family toxin n=1 Tax=Pleurocapsa sp. CCALA 161 TaxID=2107688 RepID=UPI000D07F247|nr:type II toxin-antitoxin system PemK/MazF family toxin [Pleurocapsa sp. CCALA 161]PSB06709.1 type II toxin-antitoxin system PemK/MazF family toxin [Pleurocapsa sp. CCALA 161]
MIRGDIYQADLDPTQDSEQAGRRPILKDTASHIVIVSRDGINRSSPIVVVVPITKFTPEKKIYPSHHLVKATDGNGLTQDSIIKCEQIRAIAKSRLSRKWGSLSEKDLAKVDTALKIVLSLK